MSSGARSLVVWSAYVLVLGLTILLIPNTFLSVFQIEETEEVWLRLVGMLLVALAPYYWVSARGEFTPMMEASVWVRWAIVVVLVALAIIEGPWQLVLFASVDLLGGLWTFIALRQNAPRPAQI
jgi:hypothetical protein